MKVAPRQLSAFLGTVPSEVRAVLFHGTDYGQMSERSIQVSRQFSTDLDDVFSVTKLDGETIGDDSGAIADAAAQISLAGDVRLVLVKGKGAELLDACKAALARDLAGSFIIIEARETTSRHAIVKLFETSPAAAAVGCYADSDVDIGRLAQDIMRRDNITLEQGVLEVITSRLGSDRASTRMEIEKLALMAGPEGSLSVADVSTALGDGSQLAISDIAQAVADGRADQLQGALAKAWNEDANAVMILRGCQGHFRQLLLAGAGVAKGKTAGQAVKELRPPVFFKMQDVLVRHLRSWSTSAALDAVNRLQDCELQVKSGAPNDRVMTAQCLLGLCLRAQARRR